MSAPSEKLKHWIVLRLGELVSDGDNNTPIVTHFRLWHSVEGEPPNILHSIEVKDEHDADDLVTEIWDMADLDADTRAAGARQRYSVASYRGEDAANHTSQHSFIITGSAMGSGDIGESTEPPTAKGREAQGMRMVESMFRQQNSLWERTMPSLTRENERLLKRAQNAEEHTLKIYALMQDLEDRKLERDLTRAEAVTSSKRNEQVMDMAMTYFPLVVSKFLKGKVPLGPEGNIPAAVARDQMVSRLLHTIDGTEVMAMLAALPPEKQNLFGQVFAEYYEDFKKNDDKKPEILRDGEEENEEARH